MSHDFMGRRISKEVINLGIGGQIERVGKELPPRATVEFTARATVSSIKHKFAEDGTVEESTILTVIADSFEVLRIEAAPEQQKLPLDVTPLSASTEERCATCHHPKSSHHNSAEACFFLGCTTCTAFVPLEALTDQVVDSMHLQGPLLSSCEACGHPMGDHAGEDHTGRCLTEPCECVGYVPFEPPADEENLEPVTGEEIDHEMAVGGAGLEPAESPVDAWPASEPMPVEVGGPSEPEPKKKRGRRHAVRAEK